ncbi:hypothetical protein GGR02_002004 [Anoxybacillus voinovskiensis]|uniref:YfhD family protein n=1 Tax=Anoxybacteroides voinovskiense TaxID=230470 RepID=A0A840DXJ4_9BACL|nr:hypothetical protein [Anoxybacillus voinovskiensis]
MKKNQPRTAREEFSVETGDLNAHQLLMLKEETKRKKKK